MSDLGLFWDTALGAADMAVAENDLATDDGLETAVLLSLFTDRRAEDGDVLPDGESDRRGWWGDALDGDRTGSRLWLLARVKETPDTLLRAEEYSREALAWLVEQRVAESVAVTAQVVSRGVLGLEVKIQRPRADLVQYRFEYNWAAQEARRA